MSASTLDITFAALADPTRRAILSRLMQGEASVSELAKPFDLSQPTISKHLKVLTQAGLVEQRRDAQFRPCRLNGARLGEAWVWLGGYRDFWEGALDRLGAHAADLEAQDLERKAHGKRNGKRKTKRH